MEIRNGELRILGVDFNSEYTAEDFKNSDLYEGQDTNKAINLGAVNVLGNSFICNLVFSNGMLYMINLHFIDKGNEIKSNRDRLLKHLDILTELGLDSENEFEWGSINVVYDSHDENSSINIYYKVNKDKIYNCCL